MANLSPEDIADAAAAILESAEGQGIIITDKRFSQSDRELAFLLKNQADQTDWKGWILTFLSIPQQVETGGCTVDVTYRFIAKFYHYYEHDASDGITSDMGFKRALFAANEALNNSRDLGLDGRAVHQMLQSLEDFDIENLGGGADDQLCHTAPFVFDVIVTNTY